MTKKRRLTEHEEFQIFKIVLDKVLWAGVILSLTGFYFLVESLTEKALYFFVPGLILLVIFIWIIARNFEQLR